MIWDLTAAVFVVVIIYLLVRPSSDSVGFIQAFSQAFSSIVANAADLAGGETAGGPESGTEDSA